MNARTIATAAMVIVSISTMPACNNGGGGGGGGGGGNGVQPGEVQVVAKNGDKADGDVGQPSPDATASGNVLSRDEVELLKAASVTYVHNGKTVNWGPLKERTGLVMREASNPVSTANSKIAAQILLEYLFATTWSNETHVYKAIETGFPEVLRAGSFLGALEELTRKTPGDKESKITWGERRLEDWVDQGRNSTTRQAVWKTRNIHATADKSVLVGETFQARLGQSNLSTANTMAVIPFYGDKYYAKMTYSGVRPLTDVVLVGHLTTTGASSNLNSNQNNILAFNEAAGYSDKVADIRKMFEAQNYLYTMPRATCAYVPTLQPGDVIHLPLAADSLFGFNHAGVRGGSISIYSAQGKIHGCKLRFTSVLREGPAIAEKSIKPGMTKDQVLDKIGFVQPLNLANWKWKRKLDLSKMQKDYDYFWWSNHDSLPCLVIGFSNDKVASLEMVGGRPSQPTRLTLDEEGLLKVDAVFAEDDFCAGDRVHKTYEVALAAGKYTLSLQYRGTKTPPDLQLQAPREAGEKGWNYTPFVTESTTNTLTTTITAPVNGTYWIYCACPDNGLCEFTLTIRGKAPTVIATWAHESGIGKDLRRGTLKLYSNGKIGSPDSPHTWRIDGQLLTLRWQNADAPGGAWVDTCNLSRDGRTYSGKNNLGVPIRGTKLAAGDME